MKQIKKIATILLASLMFFSTFALCACKTDENGGEEIDSSRTQIYVFNFAGGYGSDWLAAVKKRFEEAHANDVYEEGKKGVQVYVNQKKTPFNSMTNTILSGTDEVFFGEYGYYNSLKKAGVLADITDVATAKLSEYGETCSIEDKLSDTQKEYYGIKESDGTHYYALPHYSAKFGFIYNVELFDEMGYYIEKGTSGAGTNFIKKGTGREVAYGPDGRTGVIDGVDYSEDDGLPATYEEFFALLDLMTDDGVVPVTWCGSAYGAYLNFMRLALASDAMGLEETMLNYKLNGKSKILASSNGNGTLTFLPEKEIVPASAYELAQQSGWYYAYSFLEKLTMTDKYHHKLSFNGGYSHLDAQEDFINAGHDTKTKEMGILMDGTWWESEATGAFDRMVQKMGATNYSKDKRRFKMMPLPKPTEAHVKAAVKSVAPYTQYDELAPLCFIKSNVEGWKMPLVKEFMKFVHTDVSLREYTRITNSLRSFDYDMQKEDLDSMTEFGKSLVSLRSKAEVVYPYSTAAGYTANEASYNSGRYLTKSIVGGKSYSGWFTAFSDCSVSPESYFNGLVEYSRANPIVSISGNPV